MADPIDLCTLAQVHGEGLDPSLTDDDVLLQSYITAFSRAIANYLKWDLAKQDALNELFMPPSVIIDSAGNIRVFTPKANIRAVNSAGWKPIPTSAYSLVDAQNIFFWPSTNQQVNAHSGEIMLYGNWLAYRGTSLQTFTVSINYDAGFNPVPENIQVAAARLTYWAWRQRSTVPAGKTAIPELGVLIIPDAWPTHVVTLLHAFVNPRLS